MLLGSLQKPIGFCKLCGGLAKRSGNVVGQINEVTLRQARLVGDRLRTGKPSGYVTATEVDSAFYPPGDGKMSISFRVE